MSLSLVKVPAILRCFRVLSFSAVSSLPNNYISSKPSFLCLVTRNYAAPAKGGQSRKAPSGAKMKEFPVETDPYKLVTYCCGLNYLKDSEEVKLKPDNEYPDWMYEVYIGKARGLDELDPNSKLYWETVRRLAIRRNIRLHRFRTKVLKQFH